MLIALALLAGFFLLTRYEAHRGTRLFLPLRTKLDRQVGRAAFLVAHVDFAAFLREEIRRGVHHAGHATAHLSLQVVRAVERFLTRIVRSLRTPRDEIDAPRENAREFVKTLSAFKEGLKTTHPDSSDLS